jgi:hypothetical protein
MNTYRGVFTFELMTFSSVLDATAQILLKQTGAMNAEQQQQ